MQRTPTDLVHASLYTQIALPWFEQPDFRKAALVALSQELDQRSRELCQEPRRSEAPHTKRRAAAGAG